MRNPVFFRRETPFFFFSKRGKVLDIMAVLDADGLVSVNPVSTSQGCLYHGVRQPHLRHGVVNLVSNTKLIHHTGCCRYLSCYHTGFDSHEEGPLPNDALVPPGICRYLRSGTRGGSDSSRRVAPPPHDAWDHTVSVAT